ncbi:MAG: inorganic diphosphatase [Gammaproteobacteria bacterium]|nr:inorganic diphosphatase [Gammaproteobacteria bacterium]
MDFKRLGPGKEPPEALNAIIEIPSQAVPVKYEIDKNSGLLAVDRFLSTSMVYPANYGFIPGTYCDDGDPLDVLVVTPFPLVYGCMVEVRPIDLLEMTDEKGGDAKLLAVPAAKLYPGFGNVRSGDDLAQGLKQQIEHFFQQYKAFEHGKWVRIGGWRGPERAREEVMKCIEAACGQTA